MPFIVVEIVVFCTFVIEKSCELCFLEVLCVQNDRICKNMLYGIFFYLVTSKKASIFAALS